MVHLTTQEVVFLGSFVKPVGIVPLGLLLPVIGCTNIDVSLIKLIAFEAQQKFIKIVRHNNYELVILKI